MSTQGRQQEQALAEIKREEAALAERRRAVEQTLRDVAEQRVRLGDQQRQLVKEQQSLQTKLTKLDVSERNLEQRQAVEESERQALFSRVDNAGAVASAQERNHTRVEVQVEVTLHTEHNFYTGLTENISEGGIFIGTVENLAVGTELDLTIKLPDEPPLKILGQVRWVREFNLFTEDVPPGVGVCFVDLSDEASQAIEGFLHTRAPLLYDVD